MVSASMRVIFPTPARASSSALLQPIPPAPTINTLASLSFPELQHPIHQVKSDGYRDAFLHHLTLQNRYLEARSHVNPFT